MNPKIPKVKTGGLVKITKDAIYRYVKSVSKNGPLKLPREEVLCEMLGVSRVTVRSALNELAMEGLIIRRQGKGTFINREALNIKTSLNPAEDLAEVIALSGYNVAMKTLSADTVVNASPDRLFSKVFDSDQRILKLRKVFYANERPAIYCQDFIPQSLLEGSMSEKIANTPIYKFLHDNLGIIIAWDRLRVSCLVAGDNSELMEIFNCQAMKAFLCFDIDNYDTEDHHVFATREIIDTDLIKYDLIRQKKLKI